MPIKTETSPDGREVTLTISGRFDFNAHRPFRDAYMSHKEPGTRFVIDLGQIEYLDSAALGCLLLLREHAAGDPSRVRLTNCKPAIAKVLAIANFQKLVTVEKSAA